LGQRYIVYKPKSTRFTSGKAREIEILEEENQSLTNGGSLGKRLSRCSFLYTR
jgi:hypothetical protein